MQDGVPLLHDLPVQYQPSPFTPLTAVASCSGFTFAGFDRHHGMAFHAFQIDSLHAGHFRQRILDITQIGIAVFAAEHRS